MTPLDYFKRARPVILPDGRVAIYINRMAFNSLSEQLKNMLTTGPYYKEVDEFGIKREYTELQIEGVTFTCRDRI